jgi:hypothetical protein
MGRGGKMMKGDAKLGYKCHNISYLNLMIIQFKLGILRFHRVLLLLEILKN